MPPELPKSNLLITGPPGIGKTTIIEKLAEELGDLNPIGFYTLEIREGGRRKGFLLISFDGREGILSHVGIKGPHRVGKYGVDVEGFEALLTTLNLLGSRSPLVLIDEIGKMECLSRKFVGIMTGLLGSDKVVIATISARGSGFIEEVKSRPDCEIVEVRKENRDDMSHELAVKILLLVKKRERSS